MNKSHVQLLLGVVMALTMTAFATPADAYKFYSDDSGAVGDGTQNCAACHGEFRSGAYTSPKDGSTWTSHLHAGHLDNSTVGSNCDNCHGGVDTIQRGTNLSNSGVAADGVNPISCSGCHGRLEDANGVNQNGPGWGAGLRQHHQMAGIGICLPCHADSDSGAFPTAPENTMPPWYASVTNNNTGTTLAPCNTAGEEDFEGTPLGLDNDGNLLYDTSDPACAPLPPCPDMDGDGYAVCDATCDPTGQMCGDCNDMDPAVNPGAIEAPPGSPVCMDTLDNDCDGLVDAADPGCQTGCTDMDGDGYFAEGGACGPEDCNDMDPAVNPGATEVCNGIDDNCDGQIDEGVQLTFYADADGDTYGDPAMMTMACEPPPGYVADNTDCDDTNNAVNPGTPEICDNMIDDNCNGLIDGMDPACGAVMMPPPVNQNLGIMDVSFANLLEGDCRVCHGPNPPPGVPVDTTYLPDRHHMLVDQPIPPGSAVPNPDADGDGVPDTTYDCLNCHNMQFNPTLGTWELVQDFRDCLNCHMASPHHTTAQAQAGDCQACHGSLVDNGLVDADGNGMEDVFMWLPTYQPSLVTPYPGEMDTKPNGGMENPINGVREGNCSYCHDAGLTPAGDMVQANSTNHHETGFIDDQTKCVWCHSFAVPPSDPRSITPIRTCENCHGIPSLHNIQVDSDAPANLGSIVPGAENPYFGHIGSNTDCNGCHGFTAMTAPGSGPVVPQIESVTPATATAGQSTTLTITGQALTNETMGMLYASELVLEAADGTQTVVTPATIAEGSMTVVLQPELAAGNYTLRAKKYQKVSNPIILPVMPAVTVASADCSGNTVTVTGSGFGSYLEATDAGTGISGSVEVITVDKKGRERVTTSTEAGAVFSWSDTEIVADFNSCPSDVTVDSIFGSATATLGGSTEPPTDPPTASCADYTDEATCSADPACTWSVDKKGRTSCEEASSDDGSNNGGGKKK